ncbi:MAG: shikimate kinase [Butyrivibrio sp.]|nr:shikimate kinase [Butyrivibrio sp.]
MKSNIVLIGMPGVGKSSIGVVLAKALGFGFVDSDLVLQSAEKRLLKEILRQEGHDGFIRAENRVNASLRTERSVIATGGSAVYGAEAMKHLASIGTVVYLSASYNTISSRLSNLEGRGVAMREGQTLLDLYNERTPLYERYAEITVALDGFTIEEAVRLLAKRLSPFLPQNVTN